MKASWPILVDCSAMNANIRLIVKAVVHRVREVTDKYTNEGPNVLRKNSAENTISMEAGTTCPYIFCTL